MKIRLSFCTKRLTIEDICKIHDHSLGFVQGEGLSILVSDIVFHDDQICDVIGSLDNSQLGDLRIQEIENEVVSTLRYSGKFEFITEFKELVLES